MKPISLPIVDGALPSPLPPLYAAWMDECLQGPIPNESQATCSDCAMCSGGSPRGSGYYFEPRIKCCSYVPVLPNFLVGRALADGDPAAAAGRASLRARIKAGEAVTPLGLDRSPLEEMQYDSLTRTVGFGRSRAVHCPHYLDEAGGRCGIWKHRNGTCATWFCKHDRGVTAAKFWTALHRLLSSVEREVSLWCLLEMDWHPDQVEQLLDQLERRGAGPASAGDMSAALSADAYRQLWGRWAHREERFYQSCAALVNRLSWHDVVRICGPQVAAAAGVTRRLHQLRLDSGIPPRLRVGKFLVLNSDPERTRIETYSHLDPIDVPTALLEVLPYFDGRPVAEVVATLLEEKGVGLEQDLLRKLYDFRVLVADAT